jgi:hypothetical protein
LERAISSFVAFCGSRPGRVGSTAADDWPRIGRT